MNRRQFCRLLCAAGGAALLSGCGMNGGQNVEELLRAPRLSGDYGAIQDALNAWLGESAQLKYPLNGELLSPFLRGDWNGDGVEDAAVLYTTADAANARLATLIKDEQGQWHVTGWAEGISDSVESVCFAQMRDTVANQIVVGYTTQGDEYLAVYAYENEALETILEQPYGQYLIEDITGSGTEDLVLLSSDVQEQVQIQILTASKGTFSLMQVFGLSADRFTGCASLAAGSGADGKRYLVLDGYTGANGNYLASVMLCFNEETQQMDIATLRGTTDLYTASMRNVSTLYSRDLDGDGIVEIPTQPEEAGLLNLSQNKRMDFIAWMDFTARHAEKSFGLLDEEYGYYLQLPSEWEGNLLLTDGPQSGTVELRNLSGEELYLTLRVADPSHNAQGWSRLNTVASRQIQVKIGATALITTYKLSHSIYIL